MRATQVGNNSAVAKRVLDHFEAVYDWQSYIHAKYHGFFPEDHPTGKQFKELNAEINYHFLQGSDKEIIQALINKKKQMIKRVNNIKRAWLATQR